MDGSGNITVWINSPGGDSGEMQRAIDMLSSVKDSIINAYEIKTGLSRVKLAHLMDSETWMDANKAIGLGFSDEIIQRNGAVNMEVPQICMLYSKIAVVNSLMDKISEKCRIQQKNLLYCFHRHRKFYTL